MRRVAARTLAVTILALGGCTRWRTARELGAAVRAYNEALIVAYRTNDPRGLEKVAGEREVRKLIALIDLKRSGNLALESQLEEFEVLGVEASGAGAATVRTRERWRYRDRALKPGMSPGPSYRADMWMTWDLGLENGTWKVLKGSTDRSEYLEPAGFRPASTHPPAAQPPGEAR